MSFKRQLLFWAIGITVFGLTVYLLSPILLPFVAGMAMAYFLDPVADWLEELGLGRLAAVSIIIVVFALVLAAALLIVVPVLGQQIGAFASKVPGYIERLVNFINIAGPEWLKEFVMSATQDGKSELGSYAGKLAEWVGSLLSSLLSGGAAIINLLSLLIVTPVVAFYMLYDWDRMVEIVDGYLPREHAPTLRRLAGEIDEMLAGFVRGQGTVCLLLGIFYAGALTLFGLNFGLLIGLAAGLLSFVPFVGSTVGLLLSVGVAAAQFWPDWIQIAIVVVIFVVGQVIEGNFLSPMLVGDRVNLHPVWLIFALFAFGYLFGFVGMLLAVPVAAAIGVLVRFGLKQYTASSLYLGPDGDVAPGEDRDRRDH